MSTSPSSITPLASRVTPLWIVAAFVTLTEVVLGYAVTQTQGGVQISLTVFVISYALLVFTAFFLVLWNRPYVFYPPSEYGNADPKHFVEAIRGPNTRVASQIELVERANSEPDNQEATFAVIDSLIDDTYRQMIILMHENSVKIPYVELFSSRYELAWKSGKWSGGGFSSQEFARKLDGTDVLEIEPSGPSVCLTSIGCEFGQWLIDHGRKADFFETPFGSWGERFEIEGLSKQFRDHAFAAFQDESTGTPPVNAPR
jgi:hypothetical protein